MSETLVQSACAVISVDAPAQKRVRRQKRSQTTAKPKNEPNFHVIVWDDDDHSPEYVVGMLVELFGHSVRDALQITCEMHVKGMGIAKTCHRELAELKCDQIKVYGGDAGLPECAQRSMRSSIVPTA